MEKAECVLQTEIGRVRVELGQSGGEGSLSLASTTAPAEALEMLYRTAARCLLMDSHHLAREAGEDPT